jgi:L-threonylcarbamoyladenylate synthase
VPDTLLTRSVPEAAAVLRRGGTVAFPTETVYGLGAAARDAAAVAAVFRAKGRPADNPLIVHVAGADAVGALAVLTDAAAALLGAFAPGPLSLVLRARPGLPPAVTAGLETVAVRVPGHPLALALLREAGVPVVAPSANRSGRPSPTTWEAVRDDLGGRVDAVLQGPPTRVGLESTVVDATGRAPVVLRPGAVPLEALRAVVPATVALAEGAGPARSPGLRHRHYAPTARVRLVERGRQPSADAAYIGLDPPAPGYAAVAVCPDVEAYARRLFAFFREADAAGLGRIDAQAVPDAGLGRALLDRIRRAAEP